MNYVFDACAVIALLNDEDGADTVAGLINQAGIGADRIFMNSVAFYSMSLGDTFAAATARKFTATLVTGDKEMKAPEEAGEFSVLWL